MFHGLAEGQPQHDGSFVFHCSHNFAERLRRAGFNPEFVSEHVLQYHDLHDELGRRVGIWSVWTALGGRAHRPELEPRAEVHALYAQHAAGELDDLALLSALRRLHAQ
jgi:hypothetical protein